MNGTHENFSRDEAITAGSDRSFGIVMAGGFSVVALLNGWHGGKVWPLMVTITGTICIVVVVVPLLVNGLSPTIIPVNFWPFDPAFL